MCRINCSGGCPECADDEHEKECVELWSKGCNRCICDQLKEYKTRTWEGVVVKARGNKTIWRVAEFIYERMIPPWEGIDYMSWNETAQLYKDQTYDKAAEFMKKIQNNEFTGEDHHVD